MTILTLLWYSKCYFSVVNNCPDLSFISVIQVITNSFKVVQIITGLTRRYLKQENSYFLTGLLLDPRSHALVTNGRPGHLQFYSLHSDKQLYNVRILNFFSIAFLKMFLHWGRPKSFIIFLLRFVNAPAIVVSCCQHLHVTYCYAQQSHLASLSCLLCIFPLTRISFLIKVWGFCKKMLLFCHSQYPLGMHRSNTVYRYQHRYWQK